MSDRLLYEIVGGDWYNKPCDVFFTQLIQGKCDDGWEPIGAAIRHPDPLRSFWWQTMVKRVPARKVHPKDAMKPTPKKKPR